MTKLKLLSVVGLFYFGSYVTTFATDEFNGDSSKSAAAIGSSNQYRSVYSLVSKLHNSEKELFSGPEVNYDNMPVIYQKMAIETAEEFAKVFPNKDNLFYLKDIDLENDIFSKYFVSQLKDKGYKIISSAEDCSGDNIYPLSIFLISTLATTNNIVKVNISVGDRELSRSYRTKINDYIPLGAWKISKLRKT